MIDISSSPIFPELIISQVKKDDCGAVVTFVGAVRNASYGKKVAYLEIETYDESTKKKLRRIVSDVNQKWQLHDIAICRRIGTLKVGEIGLVVAVSAPHRKEAFEACQYAVDSIKQGEITKEKEIYEE